MRNLGAQAKQHASGALFRLQLPAAGEAVTDQQKGPSQRNDPSMTNTGADTGWSRCEMSQANRGVTRSGRSWWHYHLSRRLSVSSTRPPTRLHTSADRLAIAVDRMTHCLDYVESSRGVAMTEHLVSKHRPWLQIATKSYDL